MIEVISKTALSTVQDLGRYGSLRYGVGTSGAMDDLALATANLMLGNAINAAGIEVQLFPFMVRFHQDCDFAITGADCSAQLDDRPLPPWWCTRAQAGQTLTLTFPRSGCRAYLALRGGVDVPEVLGSRSTQLRGVFGGFEGRFLRQDDRLKAAAPVSDQCPDFGIESPSTVMPLAIDDHLAVRVIPAAEYDAFDATAQASFWKQAWKLTPQSNRYGFRLQGDPLKPRHPIEVRSHGIVPGVIQIPHGGQPIIQMKDAQPSGGYPKFGTVIDADLWRLSQLPIGKNVRFIETDYATALAAQQANRTYLSEVKRMTAMLGIGLHAKGMGEAQ